MSGTVSAARGAGAGPRWRPHLLTLALVALALVGMFGPFSSGAGEVAAPSGWQAGAAWPAPVAVGLLVLALAAALHGGAWVVATVGALGVTVGFLAVTIQRALPDAGGWGYFLTLAGALAAAVVATGRVGLAEVLPDTPRALVRLQRSLPAATVPFLLLLAWEGLVVGNRVPKGIFPRVSDVATALVSSWQVLMADAYLTFVREVLLGFAVGLATGFLVGAAIAFSLFLQRGFLPLATAFGAVPIVGLAPVLGRALGVDWESKAAVVVIVTFFPVVLNTVQGLTRVDPLRLELLRSYAAKPTQVFFALRFPNALPYVFNALKVSVVVAIISVIVAEFLIPGPPNGLGQRISLSAHRGAFDVVFAAILVSSVISMGLYWAISLLEKAFTAWHPSARGS